jgi:hypothetical protein
MVLIHENFFMQLRPRFTFSLSKIRKLILLLVLAIASSLLAIWTCAIKPQSSLATPQRPIDVTDLQNSAKWRLVNPLPYLVSPEVSALCSAPTQITKKVNPHANTTISVFVNPIGEKAMLSPKSIPFPVGSVIVKKKVDPRSPQDTALLYTIMIKHKLAFNPKAGGWEFAVVSGDGQQVQARGALESCMECHLPQRQKDFVFRTYLPR